MENHARRRGSVESEAGDPELSQPVAEGAAPVGLLDATGERTLAADARPIGVREARPGKGTGRKDQRVFRREGISGGGAQLEERLGDQVATGLDDVLTVEFARGDRAVVQVDVEVSAHW